MSLNGLDDPRLHTAFQAVLTESGTWLLCKYTSRDAVELLAQGTKGVPEMSTAIAEYPDASPLYGFVRYRRWNVVVKYVPEGTSRLLQVRLTVHLQSIVEYFVPHDAVLAIKLPTELTENAISATCSLHTSSGSVSSTNSSAQRRRLDEIAEDAEEAPAPGDTQAPVAKIAPPQVTVTDDIDKEKSGHDASLQTDLKEASNPRPSLDPPSTSIRDMSKERSNPVVTEINTDRIRISLDDSSDSDEMSRPVTRDLDGLYSFASKPKVKLGPRPSLDTTGRPQTAGSSRYNARPVSTLPPSIRLALRKTTRPAPKSVYNIEQNRPPSSKNTVELALPGPRMTTSRPSTSQGIVVPNFQPPGLSPSAPAIMTPEKQRLMKALELRKKQQEAEASRKQVAEMQAEDSGPKELKVDSMIPSPPSTVSPDTEKRGINLAESQVECDLVTPDRTDPISVPGAVVKSPVPANALSTETQVISEPVVIYMADSMDPLSREQTPKALSTVNNDNLEFPHQSAQVQAQKAADPTIAEWVVNVETENRPSEELVAQTNAQFEVGPTSKDTPTSEQIPAIENDVESQTDEGKYSEYSVGSVDTQEVPIEEKSEKRPRISVQTRKVDPPIENLEEYLLSDDSLMEELKSAEVQEAKPISVSKSPIRPFFPRNSSNPLSNGTSDLSRRHSGRSVSTSYEGSISSTPPLLAIPKKINVSSGISQRIKALEMVTTQKSRVSSAPRSPLSSPESSPPFPTVRKISLRSASPSLRSTKQSVDLSHTAPVEPSTSQLAPSIHAEVDRDVKKSRGEQSGPIVPEKDKNVKHKRASLSVIATIVRDTSPSSPESRSPHHANQLSLHQSPITIQQDADSPPPSPKAAVQPLKSSVPVTPSSPPIISGPTSPSIARPPSTASRLSTSSRGRRDLSPPPSTASDPVGLGILGETKEQKRESRRSRIFKRMSSLSSNSRKSLSTAISPTLKEDQPFFETVRKDSVAELENVDVGEVNIQFPDNPLWKRRRLRIDGHGFIVLSQPRSDQFSKAVTKSYHLSDFRPPFIPDLENQELANSVVLEFLDGDTLQCACESAGAQTKVLSVLTESHKRWLRKP